jgi:hypothetical protein
MGKVRQTFEWQTVDGREIVEIDRWVATLPPQEQQEFKEALKRQHQYRQEAIDNGFMIIDENNDYVWKDWETAKLNKPMDTVWLRYFERWQQECAVVLQVKFIEE